MTDRQVIQKAYLALCQYNSPSLTKKQKLDALGDCWSILSSAVLYPKPAESNNRLNSWVNGKEKDLE